MLIRCLWGEFVLSWKEREGGRVEEEEGGGGELPCPSACMTSRRVVIVDVGVFGREVMFEKRWMDGLRGSRGSKGFGSMGFRLSERDDSPENGRFPWRVLFFFTISETR